jgi:pyridinium-3,5-biscarboxylic acid mononucleotide synthase
MRKILKKLLKGEIDIETCENLLKTDSILKLDEIAKFDSHREIRTGFPEAILAQGKEYSDLLNIIKGYLTNNLSNNYSPHDDSTNDLSNASKDLNKENDNYRSSLLITRLSKDKYHNLLTDLEYLEDEFVFDYNDKAQTLIISKFKLNNKFNDMYKNKDSYSATSKKIGIITAGTSDISVGEEAKVVIEEGGCEAITSYDVGIAGIHRLFPQIAKMMELGVCAIIVCAGMEGALPSVVAGLVDVPVIGVPTSVGYGVGGKGKAALYAMLQSCAPGIAVVNIDNGFGAGVFALTIAKNLK